MSNLRGSSVIAATRPTTSGTGAFKIGTLGSRNGFTTFYKGTRQLKPTPLRTRSSIKQEVEEPPLIKQIPERSKIRVSAQFPLEKLDLSKKIQERLMLCSREVKINKRSHVLPDVRRSAANAQNGEVVRVSQQDRRPTTSLLRLTNSLFTSKRPSTSHLKPSAVSPRRALTPHLCEQVEGISQLPDQVLSKKAILNPPPPSSRPPKPQIKEAINLLKTAKIWRGAQKLRVSTEIPPSNNRIIHPQKYLSPQHNRRQMMTESTAASKCEVRCSVSRKKEAKRFTVADLQ